QEALKQALKTPLHPLPLSTPSLLMFNSSSNTNIALYWGQDQAGTQLPLSTYCRSNSADIYVVSFLDSFSGKQTNGTGEMAVSYEGPMTSLGGEISICQSLGRKVLISLGGESGQYGLDSGADGETLAGQLWDTFGGGKNASVQRPFGNVIIDGFDLDIEHGDPVGYGDLVNRLRVLYATDTSKMYYVSAAPQCPFPDEWITQALEQSEVDFAFVQFYNNDCGLDEPKNFNFDQWADFAQTRAANKHMKVFLGVPASRKSADTGYVGVPVLTRYIQKLLNHTSFGGVMMWDASSAFGNRDHGKSYVEYAKGALNGVVSNGAGTNFVSGVVFEVVFAVVVVWIL
ncbi:glycoside hydrolase superfamily, partial [Yarrowia lipolytica]